ncbi:TPA: hypothetical protein HA251_03775 [Candidatus Woesearchaeota archaeon]|nr:hypothetical protein [Candidatus Woesearchaeota archaeon]
MRTKQIKVVLWGLIITFAILTAIYAFRVFADQIAPFPDPYSQETAILNDPIELVNAVQGFSITILNMHIKKINDENRTVNLITCIGYGASMIASIVTLVESSKKPKKHKPINIDKKRTKKK